MKGKHVAANVLVVGYFHKVGLASHTQERKESWGKHLNAGIVVVEYGVLDKRPLPSLCDQNTNAGVFLDSVVFEDGVALALNAHAIHVVLDFVQPEEALQRKDRLRNARAFEDYW